MLQLPDLILNQMPLLVEMRVDLPLHLLINARWDDRLGVSLFQVQDERLRIIPLVGDDMVGGEVFSERLGLRDVVTLAACQDEAQGVA